MSPDAVVPVPELDARAITLEEYRDGSDPWITRPRAAHCQTPPRDSASDRAFRTGGVPP